MGDSLSQLPDARSPYLEVALIIVVMLWEVRNGVAVGRATRFPSILVYLLNCLDTWILFEYTFLGGLWELRPYFISTCCLYNCVAATSRVAK